jgi:hypothetical protein
MAIERGLVFFMCPLRIRLVKNALFLRRTSVLGDHYGINSDVVHLTSTQL